MARIVLLSAAVAFGAEALAPKKIEGPWPAAFPAKDLCSNCGLCVTDVGIASVTEACAFIGDGMSRAEALEPRVHGRGRRYSAEDLDEAHFGVFREMVLARGAVAGAQWTGVATGIAQSWLEGGRGWDCDCAYCRGFEEAHPADLAGAARWWAEHGKPKITKAHLGRHDNLSTHLPYLGHHPDVDIRTAAGLARVGHNHSVLQRLERIVREAVSSGDTAVLHDLVEEYLAFPGLDRWRASARHALHVAEQGRRHMAASTGASITR